MRIRNARQSAAAPRPARVSKHEVDVCGHCGHTLRRYLGGFGGEYRLLEVPICEYAIRGSKRAHPALLVSSSTKSTYAVMVDISTMQISTAPVVNIAYWTFQFANAQYVAVRGRIPPAGERQGGVWRVAEGQRAPKGRL